MYWIYKHSFVVLHPFFFHLSGYPFQRDPQNHKLCTEYNTWQMILHSMEKKQKIKRDDHVCLGI